MNNTIDTVYNEWLNKAHSRIIYTKIKNIPQRHFYSLLTRCNYNYDLVCKNLQKDYFC